MFAQLPSGHTVTFDGAFICLVDSGKGRSITNAAEDVIRQLVSALRFTRSKSKIPAQNDLETMLTSILCERPGPEVPERQP